MHTVYRFDSGEWFSCDQVIFMAALWNRAGHYICILWFLLFLSFFFLRFSPPNLSYRRVDVYHTSTHGVALVRI